MAQNANSGALFSVRDKEIRIFGADHAGAPLVVLNTLGHAAEAYAAARAALTSSAADRARHGEFTLAAVSGMDWNRDLSPWPAPAVRRDAEDFAGLAADYLRELTEEILPEIRRHLHAAPSRTVIAGYSLAGLFAVWSLYQTDAFDGAASASGSLWYPGFAEYTRTHAFVRQPAGIALSLGEKEARTRHPVMKTVWDCTQNYTDLLRDQGIPAVFEPEPGNHFTDPDGRMGRCMARLLSCLIP